MCMGAALKSTTKTKTQKVSKLLWGTAWRVLKKLKKKNELPDDPAIPLLVTYPKKTII